MNFIDLLQLYHFLSLLPKLIITPFPTPSSTVRSIQGTSLVTSDRSPLSLEHSMPQFDIVAFLHNRSHSTTAEEALSLSLLSIGAVHLSYLHHESATTFLFDSPDDPGLAQGSMDAHDRYREVSESLVDATLALTKSSMLLLGAKNRRARESDDECGEEDTALGQMSIAVDGCLLTRCLAGGSNFSEALCVAKVSPCASLRGLNQLLILVRPICFCTPADYCRDAGRAAQNLTVRVVAPSAVCPSMSVALTPDGPFLIQASETDRRPYQAPTVAGHPRVDLALGAVQLLLDRTRAGPRLPEGSQQTCSAFIRRDIALACKLAVCVRSGTWNASNRIGRRRLGDGRVSARHLERSGRDHAPGTSRPPVCHRRTLERSLTRWVPAFVSPLQVMSLYARSRPSNWSAQEPTANYPLEIDPEYVAEAHALLMETEIWQSVFKSKPMEDMTRLDLGNLIYTKSLDVSLVRPCALLPSDRRC